MKRTFFALALALALGTSVQAKTPKEVLEPYKAYRAALEADDKQEAADFAYKAWQQAEDLMGDTKTTGDLAANFADLKPVSIDRKVAWKKVVSAHKRSIDLAKLHKENPHLIEVERRAKYLRWLVSNVSTDVKVSKRREYDTDKLKAKIIEFDLIGTTFDAETTAFSAQSAMLAEDWDKAEKESKAAIAKFDSRKDGLFSAYEFAVPLYLARSYVGQERPIDAAIAYQNLMLKMDAETGHKNAISADAYGEWLRLRDEVAGMNSEDPRAKQVAEFVVPDDRTKELAPLVRRPPIFPRKFLRGSKSGFVKVRFNVDQDGHVIDPVITSSTNISLHEPTLKALENWRYTPNLPEGRAKDVETTLRYDIHTRTGRILPPGEEKIRL